jgi:hypothetical protein
MSTETLIEFLLYFLAILLGAETILHEKELIRFERKVKKYVKAFIKAIYYTVTKKEVE